jgi:uncharacterized protein
VADSGERVVWRRLGPHLWTVVPRLRHSLRPLPEPPGVPWQTLLDDPDVGPVRLTGRLHLPGMAEGAREGDDGAQVAAPAAAAGGRRAGAAVGREMVVLLHGLGGDIDSHYMVRGGSAAAAAGLACLRLNLRGADGRGADFYHAALTADVHAALASPELRPFARIYLLGYSLGGHLALRFATEPGDPRLAAVAAVCAPLDLARSQSAIDSRAAWLYRRYLIARLVRLYAAVAARHAVPVPVAAAARLRRIRDFDDRVVAPRHGFAGADDYYARASVAPRLHHLRVPALLVNSAGDPMVKASTVRPIVERPVPGLEVRWLARGGHLGFPAGLDLGFGDRFASGTRSVDEQVVAWLRWIKTEACGSIPSPFP